ncbi:nitrogenase, partial [Rhizobium phaseoli]
SGPTLWRTSFTALTEAGATEKKPFDEED